MQTWQKYFFIEKDIHISKITFAGLDGMRAMSDYH